MLPSSTAAGTCRPSPSVSVSAFPSVMAGCSSSTSTMRRAQATERLSIMKIMETIMRDIMIWEI